MPRGGRRSGTPGVAYSNRTDLATGYAGQQGTATAAAGGVKAPAAPAPAAPAAPAAAPSHILPDQLPSLDAPSDRPGEPVTAGLDIGPGAGVEALGFIPPSQAVQSIRAAYLARPTPELRRALTYLDLMSG